MAPKAQASASQRPTLPTQVATLSDIVRLQRELEQLDDHLLQLGLRASGTTVKMPKTSHLMDQLATDNKLNLLRQADRSALKQFLAQVSQAAPQLHFSFGSDPSAAFLDKLVTWLRREIHPFTLISVGLQPNIGAGCILRSTNRYFDFSLSQNLVDKRQLLMDKLIADQRQVAQ